MSHATYVKHLLPSLPIKNLRDSNTNPRKWQSQAIFFTQKCEKMQNHFIRKTIHVKPVESHNVINKWALLKHRWNCKWAKQTVQTLIRDRLIRIRKQRWAPSSDGATSEVFQVGNQQNVSFVIVYRRRDSNCLIVGSVGTPQGTRRGKRRMWKNLELR